ncbi:hypothetical protein K474DRAFT_1660386 [Panus rudis PR-1116 ss-1]|nr:hypothetical protein K474DRAFT_1660386 [Panus rudis PR-1116 ss-1]
MSNDAAAPTPPKAEDGVFCVTASSIIHAPIEKVWKTLLDFPSYPEWNPFVRKQVITDKNWKPIPDQTPKVGSYLHMTVHIPPSLTDHGSIPTQTTKEVITFIDHDNHRVAWRYISLPKWALSAERWQYLTEVDDEGKKKVKYETQEVFSGPLAYVVKWWTGRDLKKAFDAFGEALKKRSEESEL